MRETIKQWLDHSLAELRAAGVLTATVTPQVTLAKHKAHGDYTSNLALMLAEQAGIDARDIAAQIIAHLPPSAALEKAETAGPGFINFYLKEDAEHGTFAALLAEIAERGESYGGGWVTGKPRVLVEFVSANPTGPLHVGHGRGAAYGETLSALLEVGGYEVEREYYVNDAGRQIDILAVSVWLRYLELGGEEFEFPPVGYRGDYVWDVAAELRRTRAATLHYAIGEVSAGLPAGDDEQRMDGLIANCRRLLGADYRAVVDTAVGALLKNIRADLESFGVHYTKWFSERELIASGEIEEAISILAGKGHLYSKDGATWFRSSAFGDEKDRVVKRADGRMTYFASDIAYHLNKFRRGYDLIVNVWGADHHGYLPRLRAAVEALGLDGNKMRTVLVQFANLYRDGVKVQMSTRGGEFITLRELREEVGCDATRFFYVMRKFSQHMDFDVTLAKSQSNDNPVYYVQYAHARICNVFRELESRRLDFSPSSVAVAQLTQAHEQALIKRLSQYRDVLKDATEETSPQLLLGFLRELAAEFHSYYNHSTFLVDDSDVRNARLVLITAVRQLLANGLGLLGVSAPQRM